MGPRYQSVTCRVINPDNVARKMPSMRRLPGALSEPDVIDVVLCELKKQNFPPWHRK